MKNSITSLLDSEPVLTRVGPVVLAIVGYLVAKGMVDEDTANLIVALAVAVVGSGAMVSARARVWAPKKPAAVTEQPGSGD